jgi:hypothetical protein
MRRPLSLLAALACAAAGLVIAPPVAQAGDTSAPDLAGRWNSASLRMDNVGYTMKVTATGTPELYDARLRMIFQDGRRARPIDATIRMNGSRVILRVVGGDAMRGTLGMDGSLYFPTCYRGLKYVTRSSADSMCLFQEFPR